MPSFYEKVYALTRLVPPGRVTTYGTIAALAGSPMAARAVGYALRALKPDSDVPWQRVINAKGHIPLRSRDPRETDLQRALLEREGVTFDADDCVPLRLFGWTGPAASGEVGAPGR